VVETTPYAAVSEQEFQQQIVDAIKSIHSDRALCYHTFDSRSSPEGFPDIIALVPNPDGSTRLLAWEVKKEGARTKAPLRTAQEAWVEAFSKVAEIDARFVRPSTWDEARRFI